MKKRVPLPTPQYTNIDACDVCGGEALQDSLLYPLDDFMPRSEEITTDFLHQLLSHNTLGFGGVSYDELLFHSSCFPRFRNQLRVAFGLKELE